MTIRQTVLLLAIAAGAMPAGAQDYREQYEAFRKKATQEYDDFRQKCNRDYAEFVRQAWQTYESKPAIRPPREERPLPPRPFKGKRGKELTVRPATLPWEKERQQPKPVAPIRENPEEDATAKFGFYGVTLSVRVAKNLRLRLADVSPQTLGKAWEQLSGRGQDNMIRDCLAQRIARQLCDWAYLQMLDSLAATLTGGRGNEATLLTAFLYCQSGYQMRLASDGERLVMLFASRHKIFDTPYYELEGVRYYIYKSKATRLQICKASLNGEQPLSLAISKEQLLGGPLSAGRTISAQGTKGFEARVSVPTALISFYNDYPTSSIGSNHLTRWATYAGVPLARETAEALYPLIRQRTAGMGEREAVGVVLHWLQKGLVYEYDDKVWGRDRAFFAEETLYYPYADCEDRAILFSRIVRDVLGLPVALVYYPGHLAAAVRFGTDQTGDAVVVGGERYVVCDPTYIGAPVGAQMPDLDYTKTEAIALPR